MPAGTTATASAASPPWADLPPELLANIMARLHVASAFVRFHAVCYDWNIAGHGYDPPSRLLPWLVAPSSASFFDATEEQLCRCVFSKATYRAPGICAGDRRVACANGTAAWLVRGKDGEMFIANPISAERLDFPDECMSDEWLDHRHNRSIAGDGAVLLHRFNPKPLDDRFRASFLPPGEGAKWQRVSSRLSGSYRCCAAAYHRGNVVCVDLVNCHVLWPGWEPGGRFWLERTWEVRAALPEEPGKARRCSYLVEFDGGLLLASVLQEAGGGDHGLSVSLHELCLLDANNKILGGEPEVEWVRRDESGSDVGKLGDHVMFLGFPGSFAIEAAEFGGEINGGAAYFVIEDDDSAAAELTCSVYRYNFHDGVAALVERLPHGWSDPTCMWFLPDPRILGVIRPPKEGSVPTVTSGDLQGCGCGNKVDNCRLRDGGSYVSSGR
ncbi:unnamed protein product [Urochloa humidicola]